MKGCIVRGFATGILHCASEHKLATSAYTMFLIWELCLFEGPSSFIAGEVGSLSSFSIMAVFLASEGIAFLLWARMGDALLKAYETRFFWLFVMACMVTGTLLIALSGMPPAYGHEVAKAGMAVVGLVLAGIGCSLQDLNLMFYFVHIGQKNTMCLNIFASLTSILLGVVILSISWTPGMALLLGAPVLSCVFLTKAQKRHDSCYRVGSAQPETKKSAPLRFFVTAALHGLPMGVLLSISVTSAATWDMAALNVAGSFTGAMLLMYAVFKLKSDYSELLYKMGLPLMALGILLVGLLEGHMAIGVFLVYVGFRFIIMIMTSIDVLFTEQFDFSPIYIVGFSAMSFCLGQLAGIALGMFSGTIGGSPQALATPIVAFLVPAVSLFCLNPKNVRCGWGSVQIEESDRYRAFEEACAYVARENALTPREHDVFTLLAHGNSRKAISMELSLGEETVKRCASSVYRKCGVGSRQELIDLVRADSAQR